VVKAASGKAGGASPRAWQRMLSGRRLDILDPSPLDVEIEDIAHGLARVARWNGQTKGEHIFSVAQHSLLVEAINSHLEPGMSTAWQLMALLHDAPEYVVGDIVSPFKAAVGASYKTVELRLLSAIHIRFGLPPDTPAILHRKIKRADTVAAFFEATVLAGFGREEALKFFGKPEPLPREVHAMLEPVSAREAEVRFRARFGELAA
jgi:uncharacterized protein